MMTHTSASSKLSKIFLKDENLIVTVGGRDE